MYVFSNENVLLWSENNTNTLVWAKVFCFVLVEMETDFLKRINVVWAV